MNSEQEILVSRLEEAGLSLRRFIRVKPDKHPLEPKGWAKNLHTPDELNGSPMWGIVGREGLVLIDTDKLGMANAIERIFPETFTVTSPNRKLPHFYFSVKDGDVPNRTLRLKHSPGGAGEIRAQNHYLVAAGSEFDGMKYTITEDRPIAEVKFDDFMQWIEPFLGDNKEQRLTTKEITGGVEAGTRHHYGIRMATYLIVVQKFDRDSAIQEMNRWNKMNDPPMTPYDLERMVDYAILKHGVAPPPGEEEDDPKEFFTETTNSNGNPTMGSFVPKKLADRIKDERHFLTARDNEDVFVYDGHVYNLDGEATVKEMARKKLRELSKEYYISETLHHLKQTTYVPRDWLDADNPLIVTKNCVLNPETLETFPCSPEIFTTIAIPVTYDPEKDCPTIKKFITEIIDKENIELVQEICGYVLMKKYVFQKAIMMLGGGANGKSTLLRVIAAMIGDEHISTPSLQSLLYDRFSASQLYHKLANLHADIPTRELKNTGLFKMLLGGDLINAQRKHRDPFKFINYAKLIYSANELPKTDDLSPAFFRRWILIKFPNTFPENSKKCDPHILDKLITEDELSGFLNWSLKGLQRLLKQGHFTKTQPRAEIESEWIRQTDSLAAFVKENVKVKIGECISKELFFELYTAYCSENESDAITKSSVGHRLPTLVSQTSAFRPQYEGKRVTAWKDISVTDVTQKERNISYTRAHNKSDYYIEKIVVNTPDIPTTDPKLDEFDSRESDGYE